MKKILWWAVFILTIVVAVLVYTMTRHGKSAKVEELKAERFRESAELEDELGVIDEHQIERLNEVRARYRKRTEELDAEIQAAEVDEKSTISDLAKGWADYASGTRT